MTHICFTGAREISYAQGIKIEATLEKLTAETWHVGDANGVDSLVAFWLRQHGTEPLIYKTEGRQPWQLATRSKRMVDECWKLGNAKLIAFPNKPCPPGVKLGRTFSGKGSGTWGTIAYAKHLGLDIQIFWLVDGLTKPDWMRQQQLTLF